MLKETKTYLHFEDRKGHQTEKQRRIILKQMRDGTKEFRGCNETSRADGWFIK